MAGSTQQTRAAAVGAGDLSAKRCSLQRRNEPPAWKWLYGGGKFAATRRSAARAAGAAPAAASLRPVVTRQVWCAPWAPLGAGQGPTLAGFVPGVLQC